MVKCAVVHEQLESGVIVLAITRHLNELYIVLK